MSLHVECPSCGESRMVNARLAGRTIRCPGCDASLNVPEMAAVVDEDATVDVANDSNGEADAAFHASATEALSAALNRGAAARTSTASAATSMANSAGSASATNSSTAVIDDDDDDLGVPPRKKRDDGELDMTPMVDVTFLLLIFFMVTASFSLQKSIQMPKQTSDLPSTSSEPEETDELDPVELEIDDNGGFLVLAADWERETPGKQNLITALKEAIGDNKDGMQLNIKVHENAKLQFLVDGMDAGTIAGFAELQVAEVDGFD
ncbi:MAG: biopolymer transporter ExbD [Planctomycetota bacterium]